MPGDIFQLSFPFFRGIGDHVLFYFAHWQRRGVVWLIKSKHAAAGNLEHSQQSPVRVLYRLRKLHSFAL
jgi:hypothetical protein